MKEKEAIGIEIIKDNRKLLIHANKEVILSSGTINSPVLLMLSGIGPKEHLEKHRACSISSFLYNVLYIVACHMFRLASVLSVLIQITASDYLLGIFKLFSVTVSVVMQIKEQHFFYIPCVYGNWW
jgi:hypothetical protein